MSTTREDITRWFKEGLKQKATHMIVVCDTFDHGDYPVYVTKEQKVKEVEAQYDGKNMQKIMEVYNLGLDMEEQLSERRAFHY